MTMKGANYMSEWIDLTKEYNRLAKQANKRLRNLERLKNEKGFENVDKYAYARAMKDIKSQRINTSEKRFKANLKGNENINTVRAMLNDVETFLNSPTSTKKGIIETYQKRADTINEKYGMSLSWQEFESFINSETWQKMNNAYGSKTALEVAGKLQKKRRQVANAIRNGKDVSLKVEDWKLQKTLDNLLKNNDINMSDLFGYDIGHERRKK